MELLEFPLSLVLALAMVLCVLLLKDTSLGRRMASRGFSSVILAIAAVFLSVEGSFATGLFHHWAFILTVLLAMFSLAFTAFTDWERKAYSPLLSHLGFFLVLFGGLFGAPDCTDALLKASLDGPAEHIALSADGKSVPLPFNIALKEFRTDCYEDGISPRQYTSRLDIDGKVLETSVNHPCRHKGFRIYQAGYESGPCTSTVLKLVRDPWLPVVALGALMMALAAVTGLKKTWNSWKVPVAALILAIIFGVISVATINFGTLMPALRSLWFVPHLIVYMLAYAVMALSVLSGIGSIFSDRIPGSLSGKLLSTATSLLLIGMLFGAVWAKQAWGNYWTWDAKECWAAVTWLLALAAEHLPRRKAAFVFTVLAFMAIQMTWYGVNKLPSADRSLHTYNQEKTI